MAGTSGAADRRTARIAALIVVLSFTLFSWPGAVTGQNATLENASPVASPGRAVDRPARELLLQAVVRELPPAPAIIRLRRLTIPSGGEPRSLAAPGFAFLIVERGVADITVEGTGVLLPKTETGAGASEPVPVATDVPLVAGDQVAFSAGSAWTIGNPAATPSVSLIAEIVSEGAARTDPRATPGAGAGARAATMQTLGEGQIDVLPPGPAAVTMERFNLDTGIGVPAYPGPVLLAVERGGFATAIAAGDVRRSVQGAPARISDAPVGEPVAVRPGDALIFPEGMEATPPLQGDGAVVLLRLGVLPLETAEADEDAFPVGSVVSVTERGVRLRAGPSLDAAVLAGLDRRQRLIVSGPPTVEQGRTWYPVEAVENPALSGYVAAEFLRLLEQAAAE